MKWLFISLLNLLLISPAWANSLDISVVGELFVGQPVAFEVEGAAANERIELKVKRANGNLKLFGQERADSNGVATILGFLPKGYSHGEKVRVRAQSLDSNAVSRTTGFHIDRLPDPGGACDLAFPRWTRPRL